MRAMKYYITHWLIFQDQNVTPEYMAVDKPSDKFLGFLHKHYHLYKQVPQINNFVVFEPFFMDRPSKCVCVCVCVCVCTISWLLPFM